MAYVYDTSKSKSSFLDEDVHRKDNKVISDSKPLLTESGKTKEPESPEPRKVKDEVKVKRGAYLFLLWEIEALPGELSSLPKR